MAGMKFLNLKGWHPSNARNQKRIWIAEQQAKEREQRERDAAAEVKKNAETQSFQLLAAAKGDAESARRAEMQQVGFLYAPPPGLQKVNELAALDMAEDDAVREFRRKMEKRSSGGDIQRPLERYVGRRPDEMLTIKEQVERFPMLKDAPVEGDYAANVKVNFKPMGVQLRNVRCLRCNEWGHQSGDRECAMRDFNPNDAARQAREDPMAYIAKLNSEKKQELVLKRAALPLELQAEGDTKSEYEILISDGEQSDPEKKYLAGLSTKEKKRLLQELRRQTKDAGDSSDSATSDDDRRKKHRRKHAHKKSRKTKRSSTREHDTHESSHCRREEADQQRDHQRREREARSFSPKPRSGHHRERERSASPRHHRDRSSRRRERSRSRERRR